MSYETLSLSDLQSDLKTKDSYENSLKLTQKALVESEDVYRTLYYAFHDPIVTFDTLDKKIIQVNQATVELFRCKNWESLIGISPLKISVGSQYGSKSSEEQMDIEIAHALEEGSHRFFWVFKRFDGTTFDAEVSLAKAHIHGKTIVFGSIRDITLLKRYQRRMENLNERLEHNVKRRTLELENANEELRQMVDYLSATQDQLVQSEKMASLGNLVAGVAHELNTPVGNGLTGMTWLSELSERVRNLYASKELSEEDFEDYLKNVSNVTRSVTVGLKKAAGLIRSFKQVAVDQSNEEKRRFFIKEYIEEILISLNSNLRDKDIKISVNIDEGTSLFGYVGGFSQIITNLVLNSVKHGFKGSSGGNIIISAKTIDEVLHMSYSDNGYGMSQDTIEKIYEPFFTTNRNYGGTGLGMHIVYNIVSTRFNGEIDVKSHLGEGVEFIIKLRE